MCLFYKSLFHVSLSFNLLKVIYFSSDYLQGVQKKMRRSFCLISLATNIGKVGSIASSGVQKLFCTIFWSRDISKLKWGIRSQNVWILDNLSVLKSDVPYCFTFISASLYLQKCVWTFSMPNKYIIFKMGYVPAF